MGMITMPVRPPAQPTPNDPDYWICQNGEPVLVTDMSTKHIEASIAKIKRHQAEGKPWRVRWLDILAMELLRRAANEETK